MADDYNLYPLHVFRVVARLGSVTLAGRELCVSQPAVSKHLRGLENRLHLELFERTTRGMVLTAAGEALLPHANRLFGELDHTQSVVDAAAGHIRGVLEIAASSTPGAYLLPGVMKEFRERYPECDPVLTVGDTAEVLAMLRDYRVTLGVVGELSGVRDGEFVTTRIAEDELRLTTGAAHPLRTFEQIRPEHLRGETLLLRERGSSTRAGADRLLVDLAGHFQRIVEVASAEAIKEGVIAGLGVAVLSSWATRREEEQGLLYPVADRRLRMARRFYMVRRADRTLRGAAQAFWSAAARFEVMPSTPAAASRRASSTESTVQT